MNITVTVLIIRAYLSNVCRTRSWKENCYKFVSGYKNTKKPWKVSIEVTNVFCLSLNYTRPEISSRCVIFMCNCDVHSKLFAHLV